MRRNGWSRKQVSVYFVMCLDKEEDVSNSISSITKDVTALFLCDYTPVMCFGVLFGILDHHLLGISTVGIFPEELLRNVGTSPAFWWRRLGLNLVPVGDFQVAKTPVLWSWGCTNHKYFDEYWDHDHFSRAFLLFMATIFLLCFLICFTSMLCYIPALKLDWCLLTEHLQQAKYE